MLPTGGAAGAASPVQVQITAEHLAAHPNALHFIKYRELDLKMLTQGSLPTAEAYALKQLAKLFAELEAEAKGGEQKGEAKTEAKEVELEGESQRELGGDPEGKCEKGAEAKVA